MSQSKRPDIIDTFTEAARAYFEYKDLQKNRDAVLEAIPDSKYSPVMVLPGFMADDSMYKTMRDFLGETGYASYTWNAGRNWGFKTDITAAVEKRLTEIFNYHSKEKVSLIGHSLGGVFARELAREFPDMVDKVITLGSPFGELGDEVAPSNLLLRKLHDHINKDTKLLKRKELLDRLLVPPQVPTTSVYSQQDGVVHWSGCLNPVPAKGEKSENVEVAASHVGLAWNQYAFLVIADRLAQDSKNWKPFDKTQYPDFKLPEKQAHEDYTPAHPGKTPAHHKKMIFVPK